MAPSAGMVAFHSKCRAGQMLETLITGFIGGLSAWFVTDYVAKPLQRFFDLRRQATRCLVVYGNLRARAKLEDEMPVPIDISPAEDARLTKAQGLFRELAGEMRAFAHVDYFASRMVRCLGYDADKIARALLGYSNAVETYGKDRAYYHDLVQKLLRTRSES